MIKKIIGCLLLYMLLCATVGCTNHNPATLPTDDVSEVSSIQETDDSSTPAPSSLPADDVSTAIPSSTQSTDHTAVTSQTQSKKDVSAALPSSTPSATSDNTGDSKMDQNCKLIVKGKDITAAHYVKMHEINDEYCYEEIPLLAIMKELGATVEWQNKTTVKISFDGHDFSLDTTQSDFGLIIPPGTTPVIRRLIDNEIIVDYTSARGLIVKWMGAKINIDYDNRIITIG